MMDNHFPHILILGYVWPEPQSSAAGRRMMQLITIFRDQGWKVTFASSAAESEYAINLQEHGISTEVIEINSSDFDVFVKDLQPDMVLFDRFVVEEQFGWRVAEQCPDAVRILDTEDLHCLRRARRKALSEGHPFSVNDLLENEVAKREIASILRCDLSLIISEYEMGLLKKSFGVDGTLLHYLPFLLEPVDELTAGQWPPFESRRHFVTIGNFRHPPNWDSVQFLKKKVWPLVRKELPDAELHVYGAYPSQKVTDLNAPGHGFYIKGRADDAHTVLRQGRVCLAPLRFGAGLKGKLVEAMQCGTPSVTTRIGAEGLQGNLEWSGAIVDEPNEIADAAVELYTNLAIWEQAQDQGKRIINLRFMAEKFVPKLINRVTEVRAQLREHRRNNFTGQMLMHHTMASTEYMSRWIEAKNRK